MAVFRLACMQKGLQVSQHITSSRKSWELSNAELILKIKDTVDSHHFSGMERLIMNSIINTNINHLNKEKSIIQIESLFHLLVHENVVIKSSQALSSIIRS